MLLIIMKKKQISYQLEYLPASGPSIFDVKPVSNGYCLRWKSPKCGDVKIQYYTVCYKTICGSWEKLNNEDIPGNRHSYLVKDLLGGETYCLRLEAYTTDSNYCLFSNEVQILLPKDKHLNAIHNIVFGAVLFCIIIYIITLL